MEKQRREHNRKVFLAMMNALGRKDWDAGFACMTDDVYCDWPYRPIPEMEEVMIGRDVVRAFFDNGQAPLAGLDYRIDQIYELLDPDAFREERWGTAPNEHPIFFFELDRETVWGATARVLHQLLRAVLVTDRT